MFQLEIIGLNEEAIAAAAAAFGPLATCRVCRVEDVDRNGAAFVSPANSLGFMDGGIDKSLRDMFPGCEKRLKAAIKSLGHKTALGRHYLRVGSAYWQPVGPCLPRTEGAGPNTMLISAPTMFLPHDVSATQNAYWAMIAVLVAAADMPAPFTAPWRLVVPTLCCGWGRMSAADSAAQMRRAWDDFVAGRLPAREVGPAGFVLLPSRDDDQPANYDNREIGVGPYGDRRA